MTEGINYIFELIQDNENNHYLLSTIYNYHSYILQINQYYISNNLIINDYHFVIELLKDLINNEFDNYHVEYLNC